MEGVGPVAGRSRPRGSAGVATRGAEDEPMSDPRSRPSTSALQATTRGEEQGAADLLPLMYTELPRLARSLMARAKAGDTLRPAVLVHEAYIRSAASLLFCPPMLYGPAPAPPGRC